MEEKQSAAEARGAASGRQFQGFLDALQQKTRGDSSTKASEAEVNEEKEPSWRGNLFESPKKRLQARWEQVSPSLKEKLQKYSPKALRDLLGDKESFTESCESTYEENVAAMEDCSQMLAERQFRYKQIAAFYLDNSVQDSPVVTQSYLPSTSQQNNQYLPLNTTSSYLPEKRTAQPLTQKNLRSKLTEESVTSCREQGASSQLNHEEIVQSFDDSGSRPSEGVSVVSTKLSESTDQPQGRSTISAPKPDAWVDDSGFIEEVPVTSSVVACRSIESINQQKPYIETVLKISYRQSTIEEDSCGTDFETVHPCLKKRTTLPNPPLETNLDNLGFCSESQVFVGHESSQLKENRTHLLSGLLESDFPVDRNSQPSDETFIASSSTSNREGKTSCVKSEILDYEKKFVQDAFVETFVRSFSENEDEIDKINLLVKEPSSGFLEFSSRDCCSKQAVRETGQTQYRSFPTVAFCESVPDLNVENTLSKEYHKTVSVDNDIPKVTSSTGTNDSSPDLLKKGEKVLISEEQLDDHLSGNVSKKEQIETVVGELEVVVAQSCDIGEVKVESSTSPHKRDQSLPTIEEAFSEDLLELETESSKAKAEEMATMPHIVVPVPDAVHLRKSPVTVQEWVDHLPVKPKITEEPIDEPMDRAAMLRCEAAARLSREASVQSSSSLDSLLDARRPDPVEVLLNLGFGGSPGIDLENCRIPKRFLVPSKCKGGDWNEFLKRELLQAQNFECASLGFRGLSGPSHQRPSAIVANIMEKLREKTAPRPPPRSRFTSVARRVLSETSVLNKLNTSTLSTSSSVLTPDNRKFLDSQGKISPEVPRRRIILNQKSFIHKDGELVEVEHAPLTPRDSASGICSSKDSTHSDLIDSETEMFPSAEELLRKRRSSLQRQRKVEMTSDDENDLDSLKEEVQIVVPDIKDPYRHFRSAALPVLEDPEDIRGELVAEIENLSRKIQTVPREELAAILEPIKEICVKLDEL